MRFTIWPALLAGALLGTACSDSTASRMSGVRPASLDKGGTETHAIDLYAVLGTGSGGVNVTPTAEDQGTFHVQGEVHVVGAPPNTTYLVQRAPDLNVADPACTGPWISFPIPNAGPLVTLTTDTTSFIESRIKRSSRSYSYRLAVSDSTGTVYSNVEVAAARR